MSKAKAKNNGVTSKKPESKPKKEHSWLDDFVEFNPDDYDFEGQQIEIYESDPPKINKYILQGLKKRINIPKNSESVDSTDTSQSEKMCYDYDSDGPPKFDFKSPYDDF
jgi:hypothetical protein